LKSQISRAKRAALPTLRQIRPLSGRHPAGIGVAYIVVAEGSAAFAVGYCASRLMVVAKSDERRSHLPHRHVSLMTI